MLVSNHSGKKSLFPFSTVDTQKGCQFSANCKSNKKERVKATASAMSKGAHAPLCKMGVRPPGLNATGRGVR